MCVCVLETTTCLPQIKLIIKWLCVDAQWLLSVRRRQWGTGEEPHSDCAAGSGVPCCPAVHSVCAMCLCWCCVCLRLRTSTGQRTTTAPSIMALFQLVHTTCSFLRWSRCSTFSLFSKVVILFLLRAAAELNGCCQCCIYQDFHGVPAVQPIKQKAPGTKMEKDWASGTCSVIRKAKSNKTKLGIRPVRATTKSRWGDQMWCVWDMWREQKGSKGNLNI